MSPSQTVGKGFKLEDHRRKSLSLISVPLPSPIFMFFFSERGGDKRRGDRYGEGETGCFPLCLEEEAYRTSWQGKHHCGAKFLGAEELGLARREAGEYRETVSLARGPCSRGTLSPGLRPTVSRRMGLIK